MTSDLKAEGDEIFGPEVEKAEKVKQSDAVLNLLHDIQLFHNPDGEPFATFTQKGALQTHRVRSSAFKNWLAWRAHDELKFTPSNNAISEALQVIEGKARFDGPTRPVARRLAEHLGKVYLDLADDQWRVIEVDAAGWRLCPKPPVVFIRGTGALPLPMPVRGGNVRDLRRFLNCDDQGFEVILGWLIGALQPHGPYPVLALTGRHGSAKSFAARLLTLLTDPNKAPHRSAPKSEDDLIVAAQHARVVCFDNLSRLSDEMSDSICRLATGGGTSKRKLFTDNEAVVLDVQLPVMLTGIGNFISRGDLADRALPVQLRVLRDGDYKPERELLEKFERVRSGIIGSLLDALAAGIGRRSDVRGTSRMADFEAAVDACGLALGWKDGYFTRLLAEVRDRSRKDFLAEDELASALIEVADFKGSASELRERLIQLYGDKARWIPKTARALRSEVDRAAPLIEAAGVYVSYGKRKARSRPLIIEKRTNGDRHDGHDRHDPTDGTAGENDGSNDGGGQIVTTRPAPEDQFSTANDGSDGDDGSESN
ncbi:MAG: hypothetical protein DPW14_09615 [Planctomycetes bacterium]|nr:hypothetical protein [Planctomycetota bacterium]